MHQVQSTRRSCKSGKSSKKTYPNPSTSMPSKARSTSSELSSLELSELLTATASYSSTSLSLPPIPPHLPTSEALGFEQIQTKSTSRFVNESQNTCGLRAFQDLRTRTMGMMESEQKTRSRGR
ncbi:hypothetical protein HYC85_023068 [Camellia sinensis]|uniref:Uncharacterized protein n=1 Tax=Camellia sinensis TaxID=4442 RepID=A0A7J7GDH0_CAMSI|nr:hypothetical protein HYC85_023068 [Camellia sinensis]